MGLLELADFSTPWLVLLSSFLVCMASAVVPLLNSEVYLILLSAAVPPGLLIPAVVVATLGHMVGKSVMFFSGRGLKRMSGERIQHRLAQVASRLERWRGTRGLFIFVSAAFGVPPFYLVAVAAGTLRLSFAEFLVAGFAGRLLRFAAVAGVPQLLRELL